MKNTKNYRIKKSFGFEYFKTKLNFSKIKEI